jgi:hypothetical protein
MCRLLKQVYTKKSSTKMNMKIVLINSENSVKFCLLFLWRDGER